MTTLLPRRPDIPAAHLTSSRHIGEVSVVRFSGDLDLAAVEPLSLEIAEALAARPTGLVLDLAAVGFCDTVGLRILLSAAAKARRQGCSIGLAGLQRPVAELLARVGAERTLPAYADVADAIEGLMFAGDWR